MVFGKRPIEDRDDRMKVLIALALQQKYPAESCLSAGQLAAFKDGHLHRDERCTVLEHLDACPFCYRQWLSVASVSTHGAEAQSVFKLSSVFHKRKRKIYIASGFVTAIAACLILFILPISDAPDVGKLIAESYQFIIEQEAISGQDELNRNLILPWESTDLSYGFGSGREHSPAAKAFGAGLWTGKQKLLKDISQTLPDFLSPEDKSRIWTETEWSLYFWLGRWSILLKGACLSEPEKMPYDFWKHQVLIFDQMQKKIEARSETEHGVRIVNAALGSLKSVLKESERSDRRKCRKIASELELLIQGMRF